MDRAALPRDGGDARMDKYIIGGRAMRRCAGPADMDEREKEGEDQGWAGTRPVTA